MLPLPYGLQGPYLSTGGVKTYVPSGKSHHGDVSQKKEWGPPYECAPYESPPALSDKRQRVTVTDE